MDETKLHDVLTEHRRLGMVAHEAVLEFFRTRLKAKYEGGSKPEA